MTSVIVPPVDLAPGMPSRVVTVSATDLTEGGQSLAGQKVTFALSDSLDVISGGDVIAKTTATIELDANGNGSIRLPVYSEDVKTWCGRDWWVLVTAFGSGKAVRVPTGTSSIALSALPNVRPLRGRELQWAVTGAGITIVEGSQWGASVTLDGGVLRFTITVPPGGTAWWKGALGSSANLGTIDNGVYSIWSGDTATTLGLPEAVLGIVESYRWGTGAGIQIFRPRTTGGSRTWQRTELSEGWGAWERTDGGKLDQTGSTLTSTSDLGTLPNGFQSVWSGSIAEALGLPTATGGTLITVRYGTQAGTQLWMPRTITPQLWQRTELTTWTPWTRVDAGAAQNIPMLRSASPGGLKTAPLALTLGYGGAQASGSGTTTVIQHMPASARRVQLHLRNWNPRYTMADSAAVSLSQVAIGLHSGGGAAASWTTVPAATGTTGTDGYLSGWVDVPEAWRGKDVVVRYAWSGSTVQRNIGTGWEGGARNDTPALFAWLEVEVPASTPVIAAFGDSLSSGVSSSRPVVDSWVDHYARSIGAVPAHWSHSGDKAAGWQGSVDRKWGLYGWDIAAPDAMVYLMGSNDLSEPSITLAEMQTRFTETVASIRARITPNVFAGTIFPRTTEAVGSTFETVRRQVNTWLPASGLMRRVYATAAAISGDDETILPAFDADGIHLTSSGYAAVAGAITPAPVAGLSVTYVGDGVYEIS